ncbi:MAG: ferrochelatase [Omnitrophica bacterium GWA2_52_8]|nr:MAG: ferrochelatase [Omnitrophica bacterium GWA2_52_8]
MPTRFDHVLFLGFGGPGKPEDIEPFLQNVAAGRQIPPARLAEVKRHYELVGGFSPYNELTFACVNQIKESLMRSGLQVPVYLGMRNWRPYIADVISQISGQGLRRGLAVILAPHRSSASCFRYKESIDQAIKNLGGLPLKYTYLEPWGNHPLFIRAQADLLETCLRALPYPLAKCEIIFSAHSIPERMNQNCRECSYSGEYETTCSSIASRIGITRWTCAYQSRSGLPQEPWLRPDVEEVLRGAQARQMEAAVVVPVGFFCDYVEVLYDLDIDANRTAQKLGIHYARVPTAVKHPDFIRMFAESIREFRPVLNPAV